MKVLLFTLHLFHPPLILPGKDEDKIIFYYVFGGYF